MDEILHHLRKPGMIITLEAPTQRFQLWFQFGATMDFVHPQVHSQALETPENQTCWLTPTGLESERVSDDVRRETLHPRKAIHTTQGSPKRLDDVFFWGAGRLQTCASAWFSRETEAVICPRLGPKCRPYRYSQQLDVTLWFPSGSEPIGTPLDWDPVHAA